MINNLKFIGLSLLFIFVQSVSAADASIDVSSINDYDHIAALPHAKLSSEKFEILSNALVHELPKADWTLTNDSQSDLAVSQGKNFFFFELENNTKDPLNVYFTFKSQFRIIENQLFTYSMQQAISPIEIKTNSGGLNVAIITVAPLSRTPIYFKVNSDVDLGLPIKLIGENNFYHYVSQSQFENGFFIGGIALLVFITVVLFFTTGSVGIILLFGYLICRVLLLTVILGGNLYYLYPQLPELRMMELPILSIISLSFLMHFCSSLFDLKTVHFPLYRIVKIISVMLLATFIFSFFIDDMAKYRLGILIEISGCLLVFALGVSLIKRSQPLGVLVTANASIYFVFMVFTLFSVHFNNLLSIDQNAVYFGAIFWLNTILVTAVISKKYYLLIQGKQEIQNKALESAIAAKKANDKLLELERDNQEELEAHVQERTLELSIALQELENSNRELELKNTQDALSGLFNRRYYDKKILAEYRRSKRNLTPLSLVLIDIDHFKQVNDTYGHLAGDHCLVLIGKLIKDNLKRSTDIGCRYGGEEFCLILPDTDEEGAFALAEDLRLLITKKPILYKDINIELTISCGISTYKQQDNIEPEQLFSGADKALYLCKKEGRNQVRHYTFTE